MFGSAQGSEMLVRGFLGSGICVVGDASAEWASKSIEHPGVEGRAGILKQFLLGGFPEQEPEVKKHSFNVDAPGRRNLTVVSVGASW